MNKFFYATVVFFCFVFPLKGFSQGYNSDLPEWTILVFLNADNNLHFAGLDDIKEMERLKSSEKINIVVQFDGKDESDSKRLLVNGNSGTEVLEEMGEVDMGDWKNFRDFIIWGAGNYPAKKYFVIVWNHGSGWKQDLYTSFEIKGISYDDTSHNHISTTQLGRALKEAAQTLGKKIDIYGSDACLMGMIEVAWEIKDYTNIIIGSEETEPFDGWPYDDFLAPLLLNPKMDEYELAGILVNVYGASYDSGSQGQKDRITLSAVNSQNLNDFADGLTGLMQLLINYLPEERENILSAIDQSQGFSYSSNKDIFHFIMNLQSAMSSHRDIYEASWYLSQFYGYVIMSSYSSSDFKGAFGLAAWLPESKWTFDSKKQNYSELSFAKDTNWVEFLEVLHKSANP